MNEADLWREAFERLYGQVTEVCDPDLGAYEAPEDAGWAFELRGLAAFAHEVAHKAELNVAYAEITSKIRA